MAPSSPSDATRMRELILKVEQDEIKIRPALHRGKLEPQARKLLTRLANEHRADSKDAIEALVRLENWCERKGRGSCWPDIVIACINAERQARTFPENIKKAKETLVHGTRRRKETRKALAKLREFFRENQNKNWAVLFGHAVAIEHGLDLLEYGIDTEESGAEEAFAQLGATRKTEIETAPMNAAIWALAQAVNQRTGKPHYGEVASLGSVIFVTTIDETMVKHAVRKRKPRFDAKAALADARAGHNVYVETPPWSVARFRKKSPGCNHAPGESFWRAPYYLDLGEYIRRYAEVRASSAQRPTPSPSPSINPG